MSDESIDKTTAISSSSKTTRSSGVSAMAQFLIEVGLVDSGFLAKFSGKTPIDQLSTALDHLVKDGKLNREQRDLLDRFAELVLAEVDTNPDAFDDTMGFSLNSSIVQSSQPSPSNSDSNDQASSGDFGDYEILDEIARGGMGVVYKARQISLNRTVAIKKVLSGQLAGEEEIKRFQIEAEASAILDHPGIVPVYDFGEYNGQHYFSMGYVDGQSLSKKLGAGPLPAQEAAELLVKISRAVAYANAHGVIHRDLKPSNVLLDSGGEPRVSDFGLAKKMADDSGMTATGQILGTPSYMPPEQAEGKGDEVDQRADVYSLGAILYATLTGRPPFQAAKLMETLKQVLEQEPVSVRQLVPNVPRDLETICLKCLHKDAGRRYETGDALADDLERWLGGEPIVARRVSRVERAWKWCKRKPLIAGAAATILLLVTVGSLIFWERMNASYADGLVQRLGTSEPGQVNEILDELPDYRPWTKIDLRKGYDGSDEGSIAKLHFALALLSFENPPLEFVIQRLLNLPPGQFEYIAVIGDALGSHKERVVTELWQQFQVSSTENDDMSLSLNEARLLFRSGLALAYLDGKNDQWTDSRIDFLVDQFTFASPFVQPELLRLLTPIQVRVVEPLEELFHDPAASASQRVATANALTFFFVGDGDSKALARLLLSADAQQYKLIYEGYRQIASTASDSSFKAVVSRQPTDDMHGPARIALGKERAAAAITMLRHGERETMLEVLRFESDPEAMTQFVHRCRERGVTPTQLLELLELVDQRRGPLDGDRLKSDDNVMYGLLLALGEYAWAELPANRDEVATRLAEIYALDPSSGVHSASGWLLRTWGQIELVDPIDQTPVAYDDTGHREWFVHEIETVVNVAASKYYLTFIVFQSGEYTVGSPDHERHRISNEALRQVTAHEPMAVLDRELTWEQWMAMDGPGLRDAFSQQFARKIDNTSPVFGIDWIGAISYCRWLSYEAGFPVEDFYYSDLSSLARDARGSAIAQPLDLEGVGFRLPTEDEWERVCRSNTVTAFSFGSDDTLMSHYAWLADNTDDWSKHTALLRPNPRGLFDLYGNVWEWCHDWEVLGGGTTQQTESNYPGARGGAWFGRPATSRSSYRASFEPAMRLNGLGFRVVVVPNEVAP